MPGVTTAYQNGIHSARPAANAGCILYACSTHSLIYRSDGSSWATWMTIGTSTTSVATDPIFDAAGDIPVGTGADTAAKLAIGAAGGAVSRVNGAVAWNSGTSFPSAATGDRYWRTDLGKEAYYDGTRWLCTCPHTTDIAQTDHLLATSGDTFAINAIPTDYGIYLVKGWFSFLNSGTNDGSNYWSCQLFSKTSASGGNTNRGSAVTTASSAASQWLSLPITLGIAMATTQVGLGAIVSKTGASGALYWAAAVEYRHILT